MKVKHIIPTTPSENPTPSFPTPSGNPTPLSLPLPLETPPLLSHSLDRFGKMFGGVANH